MDIIHAVRRPRCFVFDNPKSVRSSYSVKTQAYSYANYVIVMPASALMDILQI